MCGRASTRTGQAALKPFVGRCAGPCHVWGQVVKALDTGLARRALAHEIDRKTHVLRACQLADGAKRDQEKYRKHQLEITRRRVPGHVISVDERARPRSELKCGTQYNRNRFKCRWRADFISKRGLRPRHHRFVLRDFPRTAAMKAMRMHRHVPWARS